MNLIEIIQASPMASLIFALTLASSFIAFQRPDLHRKWMLHPYSFVHGRRYGTIITSGLIHGDLMHLLFNMFTYFFFAFSLEEFMVYAAGPAGHFYFLLVYILSMVLADITSIVKHKDDPHYFSLGASGAIAGVLFGSIAFNPGGQVLLYGIPIPNLIFAVLYIVYSVYSGRQNRDNINHEAHLWGSVTGFVLVLLIFPVARYIFSDYISELLNGASPF